jgi:predicted DNA-binding WGR domain protein
MTNRYYEVQEYTLCGGWVNNWSYVDSAGESQPTTFDSELEARASLDEFFNDEAEAVAQGYIEDMPDAEQFRIVEVNL